ncbi:hypothetical protein AB0M43_22945 [Longispora sp. NPDC051575]|uniref:hypothetical protein n=1 Tax=Longispora sp. NPDC051575 TaxID=3154943 RepID=UPI00342A1CC5
MDLSAFYGVVAGINFTLLGLWWVAAKDRPDMSVRDSAGRRMAYLVSLQFVVPGTVSLLSQVAPDVPTLWRVSFTFAGLAGALGIALLVPALRKSTGQPRTARALLWGAVPVYLVVAAVAAIPPLGDAVRGNLTSLQVEAILLCLLVFLGVQSAWVVAMAPREPPPTSAGPGKVGPGPDPRHG